MLPLLSAIKWSLRWVMWVSRREWRTWSARVWCVESPFARGPVGITSPGVVCHVALGVVAKQVARNSATMAMGSVECDDVYVSVVRPTSGEARVDRARGRPRPPLTGIPWRAPAEADPTSPRLSASDQRSAKEAVSHDPRRSVARAVPSRTIQSEGAGPSPRRAVSAGSSTGASHGALKPWDRRSRRRTLEWRKWDR